MYNLTIQGHPEGTGSILRQEFCQDFATISSGVAESTFGFLYSHFVSHVYLTT